MSSTLTRDELETVVSAAVRAPSVLNTQPWKFRASGSAIDVWADPTRSLGHLDPQGRELLMSCGAAVLNLRLAVAALGRAVSHRLLPQPSEPTWVANVQVGGRYEPTAAERRLHAAIPNRRASRHPFDRVDVPDEVVTRLAEAAGAEGARLEAPPTWHRAALAKLVRDADRRQRDNPDVVQDIRQWTGDGATATEGVPTDHFGPKAADPTSLVRDFSLGHHVPDRESKDFGEEGLLLVLLTDHDGPIDRVRAGQALERVWLEATDAGVSLTMLTQPKEVPELRPWLRDPSSPWGSPQALLRIGYGPTPPATSRRPLTEVLEVTP